MTEKTKARRSTDQRIAALEAEIAAVKARAAATISEELKTKLDAVSVGPLCPATEGTSTGVELSP